MESLNLNIILGLSFGLIFWALPAFSDNKKIKITAFGIGAAAIIGVWLVSFINHQTIIIRFEDVGKVVVAPQIKIPPVPAIVQTTEPRPAGYYQKIFADYLSSERNNNQEQTTPPIKNSHETNNIMKK